MARAKLLTLDEVDRWIRQKAGKPVVWAVATDNGPPPQASWSDFTSSAELPREELLLIRVKGDKGGGVHVLLPKAASTALSTEIIPPSLRQRELELRAREEALAKREREVSEAEQFMLAQQRQVQVENVGIQWKLVGLSDSVASNLQKWEQSSHQRLADQLELLKAADEALQRAQASESRNETAASIAYAADRVIGALQLWKAKSLKDIPPEMTKQFQEFLLDRAQKRFYEHLPDGPRKWCGTFMQLTDALRKETLTAITEAMAEEKEQHKKKPTGGMPPSGNTQGQSTHATEEDQERNAGAPGSSAEGRRTSRTSRARSSRAQGRKTQRKP